MRSSASTCRSSARPVVGGRATRVRSPRATDSAAAVDTSAIPVERPDRHGLPVDPTLSERLAEARRRADQHLDHGVDGHHGRTGCSVEPDPVARRRACRRWAAPRTVPAPDPVARDYLLLALRLDQRVPGLVDGYFGPADLKAQVDMEQLVAPARLRDDAAALRARLAAEVDDPGRRAWLDAQLVALETQAAAPRRRSPSVPGARRPVLRVRAAPPARTRSSKRPPHEVESCCPGPARWPSGWRPGTSGSTVPVDRLPAILAWLVGRCRERAAALFGLPGREKTCGSRW